MRESTDDKTTRPRGARMMLFFFPLMIGLIGLYRVVQGPHFESYRTIDVAQLLVSGAGLGVALVVLMFTVLRPRF